MVAVAERLWRWVVGPEDPVRVRSVTPDVVTSMTNYQREQMRAYMQARRARIRAELVARLGGKCTWCEETEGLEFDHKDPKTKLFAISNGLDRPRAQLLAEVDKCQLLCGPHHREKTLDDEPHPNRARGERGGTAVLRSGDVLEIRATAGVSAQVLGDAFGVSKTTIRRIQLRENWKHI
jgi:hypothetical protein